MTLLDSASFMLQPLICVNRQRKWDFSGFLFNCGEHLQTAFGAEVSTPAPANPILDSSGQQTNPPRSSKAFYWPWNRHHFKDIHLKAFFFHVTQLTRLLYTRFCLWRGRIKNGCRTNDEARVGESVSQVKAALCATFLSLTVRWLLLCWAQVTRVCFYPERQQDKYTCTHTSVLGREMQGS